MSKTLRYEGHSIVYCKGDCASFFYVLKTGMICVSSDASVDLGRKKGEGSSTWISPGGFFGVQAFLGDYPHRETAVCTVASEVFALDKTEFEQMVANKTEIVFRILRMLSSELFAVHDYVSALVCNDVNRKGILPEDGLYNVGNYLFGKRYYRQALVAMQTYLLRYPQGKYVQTCKQRVVLSESNLTTSRDESSKLFFKSGVEIYESIEPVELEGQDSDIKNLYQSALLMFEQGKNAPALHKFSQVLRAENSTYTSNFAPMCMYYIGVAFMNIKKSRDAINSLTQLLQKYPQHEKVPNAMLCLAQCYGDEGDVERSEMIYDKLSRILPEDSPLWSSLNKKRSI